MDDEIINYINHIGLVVWKPIRTINLISTYDNTPSKYKCIQHFNYWKLLYLIIGILVILTITAIGIIGFAKLETIIPSCGLYGIFLGIVDVALIQLLVIYLLDYDWYNEEQVLINKENNGRK